MKASKEVIKFLSAAGKKGGSVKTPAKIAASKLNGLKGGRPKKNKEESK